jgi:hypothetical protein
MDKTPSAFVTATPPGAFGFEAADFFSAVPWKGDLGTKPASQKGQKQ